MLALHIAEYILDAAVILLGIAGYLLLTILVLDGHTSAGRNLPAARVFAVTSTLFIAIVAISMFGWVWGFAPAATVLVYQLVATHLCPSWPKL